MADSDDGGDVSVAAAPVQPNYMLPQPMPMQQSAPVPVFAAPDPTGVQNNFAQQQPVQSQPAPAAGDNRAYAMKFFQDRGYSPQAAAGIVAGLRGENLNGNYAATPYQSTEHGGAINPNGAYGIAQLNGPRQQGLVDYAKMTGGHVGDLDTQLGHVDYELQNSYPSVYKAIMNAPTSQAALGHFVSGYEVPHDIPGQIQARSGYLQGLENMAGAAYDKGAQAAHYVAALPGKAYDAAGNALSAAKTSVANALMPAAQFSPSKPVSALYPAAAPASPSWYGSNGQTLSSPFGAVGYGVPPSQPNALAQPQGFFPTLLNGISSALSQLFGITPAEASPAQMRVAAQAASSAPPPANVPLPPPRPAQFAPPTPALPYAHPTHPAYPAPVTAPTAPPVQAAPPGVPPTAVNPATGELNVDDAMRHGTAADVYVPPPSAAPVPPSLAPPAPVAPEQRSDLQALFDPKTGRLLPGVSVSDNGMNAYVQPKPGAPTPAPMNFDQSKLGPAGTLNRMGGADSVSNAGTPQAFPSQKNAPLLQQASGAQPTTEFERDFDVAPPAKASGSASSAPADTGAAPGELTVHASPGVRFATPAEQKAAVPTSEFERDFDVAPAAGTKATGAPVTLAPITASATPDRTKTTDSMLNANATGIATGVPIVGPAFNSLVDKGVAGILSLRDGKSYAEELARVQQQEAADVAAHPVAHTVGAVTGGVLGTAPAIALAPEAFGIGAGNLALRAGTAGIVGAGIGGADAAARNGLDTRAIAQGAGIGAAGGAAGPVVGQLVGSGVGAAANALSRVTPAARNIAGILGDVGMNPADARAALARIGPNATLADIDPALTTEAGGLASLGGQPTSVLKGAMAARSAGADNRVSQAIDQAIGPKPDLEASMDAMLEHGRQTAAPFYNAARATAGPMDVQPLVSDIDSRIANTTGGVRDALRTARSYLVQDNPGFGSSVKSDPQQLLGVRQALDDLIERRGGSDTTAGRNALREVQNVRSNLDAVLKEDPNIAAGDRAFSSQMQLREAMQDGTQLFTKGVRPEEFQRSFAAMSPDQQQAFRAGARVSIGDAMDQARRGTLSGAQSMFARGSANRAKLETLFPNANDVFDMLHGEAAMRGTEQRVAMNSATAERQAVQAKYRPQGSNALDTGAAIAGEAMGGGPGALGAMALKNAYSGIRQGMAQRAFDRLTEGTANALSATGRPQSAFLDMLDRAYRMHGVANALSSGANVGTNLLTRFGSNALVPAALAQP